MRPFHLKMEGQMVYRSQSSASHILPTSPNSSSEEIFRPKKERVRVLRRGGGATPAPKPVRDFVPTRDLRQHGDSWLFDGEARGHSLRNQESNGFIVTKLCWWLRREGHEKCGADEIRGFLHYVRTSHELPEGRWGERGQTNRSGERGNATYYKAVSPRTVQNYFRWVRAFFNWMKAEGILEVSPFDSKLKPPIHRDDQVCPFTEEQLEALLAAARASRQPHRDTALFYFLLDTGCRASEVCALKYSDVDLLARKAVVLGKGSKRREVMWSPETGRALRRYLQADGREENDPLFVSESGNTPGAALTRGGLLLLIRRLGKAAGLEMVRCSPHTFRHTFAVMFLRAGGSQMALMEAMGHTNLDMTRRYVAFSAADRANQTRQFSPVAALGRKK
jgi:integrase/recombinase XerC